ncbi:MAG TPA: hypothetical protein VK961_03505 [Chthoniobacter sp.]|nr:hypothetical protein [Chthoniobacter sp.]
MRPLLASFALLLLTAAGWGAETFQRAFWVWHRAQPLTVVEKDALAKQDVNTLYWNVGEMQNRRGVWRWKSAPLQLKGFATGFHVVPVVRLSTEEKAPFAAAGMPGLLAALKGVANAGELQIDFDCPDRLLEDYAAALTNLRRTVPHLSITALTNWPALPGFPTLARSVEELAPMFYDMQGDPTGVSVDALPPPILDLDPVSKALKAWSACATPWRAGLPTFARLTVFDRTGLSRGQIPNWSWDDFCFQKNLRTLGPTHLGVTLFRAEHDVRVARTPVTQEEIVASRFVDRAALARVFAESREAGAKGTIFFRLADETDPAGWSIADLGALASAEPPRLVLRPAEDDRLELINESEHDLPARLSGPKGELDRGYALEVDAPAALFRDALAGDFWRVASHANPDAEKPTPVAVPLATRLTFWFSHLPAHARLQTGLLQLAPGATFARIRYRILNCEGATEWKPILPAETTVQE